MAFARKTADRTLGQLVAQISEDLSFIVHKEIQLAKTELSQGLSGVGKGAGMLVGAGVVALYALGILLTAAALVIAIWLPTWAGFLIVGVVLVVVALVLAMIGRKALQAAKPVPERAIAQAQETVATLKAASPATAPTLAVEAQQAVGGRIPQDDRASA